MATADASSTFSIDLQDGTSDPAKSATQALESLRSALEGDTKALAAMQKAMKNLQGGTTVNIDQFKKLKEQIDAKKASIASAQSSYLSLGGSFNKSKSGIKSFADRVAELNKTAQGMPGPLGGAAGKLTAIRAALGGGAVAAGLVGVAAGFALLAVGATAATIALLKYGVTQADVRRNELLRLEGLTKMRNIYGIAAGNAGELQSSIDRVSGSVSISRDKVAQYAEQLYKMHLRGDNLSAALEGVAIKSAVQGEAAASAFAGWAAGAALTGRSVRKLADDVKSRLGGIAARQMLSLGVQSQKLQENFNMLFSGLKVEGLLTSLNGVTSLLSQSTASGRALRLVLTTMFQPMINAMEYLGPYVKRFFQGMIIGGLVLTIALLQIRNWLRKTFADQDTIKGIDAMKLALYAGVAVVSTLAGGLAALAIAAGLLMVPFVGIGTAIWGVLEVGYKLFKAWQGIDWTGLGTSIVSGIVNGLKNGAKWVIDAVKSLGKGASQAFKSALGIASPSKEFTKLGLAIPQGVEKGVNTGQPGVEKSVDNMVGIPKVPTADKSQANNTSAVSNKSSMSVSMGDTHIHVAGNSTKEMVEDFARQLESVFQGLAIQMGASKP